MKKILFIVVACLSLVGCKSELGGDFNKVKFGSKDISGYWVLVDKTDGYDESKQYANVGDVILFIENKLALFSPKSQDILDCLEIWYVNCTIADFDKRDIFTFEIKDDNYLYVMGDYDWMDGMITLEGDTLIVDDDIYTRINAF